VFAQHLPAGILSQVAYGVVFAIADSDLSNGTLGARAATITSLLMLGVPRRAQSLSRRPALTRSTRAEPRIVLLGHDIVTAPRQESGENSVIATMSTGL